MHILRHLAFLQYPSRKIGLQLCKVSNLLALFASGAPKVWFVYGCFCTSDVSARLDKLKFNELSDGWTVGQLDSWTVGQLDSWTVGQLDSWTVGQLDSSSSYIIMSTAKLPTDKMSTSQWPTSKLSTLLIMNVGTYVCMCVPSLVVCTLTPAGGQDGLK
jgi:hypothetical protein